MIEFNFCGSDMKKIEKFLVCWTLVQLFSMSNIAAATVTIGTANESFSNYMHISDGLPVGGFEYDLMTSICTKVNLDCQWVAVEANWAQKPFPGVLSNLDRGDFDIAIAFMRGTEERLRNFEVSIPYLQTKTAFFRDKNHLNKVFHYVGDAPVSADGKKVKFVSVGAYNTSIINIYKDAGLSESHYEITQVNSMDDAIKKLKSGAVDFTFSSAGNSSLATAGISHARFITPSPSIEWGPRIYAKNRELMKKINYGLREVMNDSSSSGYLALVRKYNLKHYIYPIKEFIWLEDKSCADLVSLFF